MESFDSWHNFECLLCNDRSRSILALECLVIDDDEVLGARNIHIVDGREIKFLGRNYLGYTFLEGYGSRHILHCLL